MPFSTGNSPEKRINSPAQVLFASLVGTAVEFFDFYIYATAAVLVFPHLFFPKSDPATATLASLATFAVAFFARPIGSALFGHYGDRIGRKRTLVLALSTMGVSTFLVGKKLWQGWVVAGANSIIICAIGMRTAEFGFLPGNLFCIGLYANNLWNRRLKAQIANSRSRPLSHNR